MSAMIDRWHDAYHNGPNIDLINCPHCQDEYMSWDAARVIEGDGMIVVDRLEDLEV